MLKIFLAFVAFAAVSMFILIKSGADIDMGGEKHGVEAHGPAHGADAASAPASAPAPAAPAASK